MAKHHRKKTKAAPTRIPRKVIERQVRRVDHMVAQWLQKWPHGVNPRRMLQRCHGPIVMAYRSRSYEPIDFLARLEALERELTIPGLIEVEHANQKRKTAPADHGARSRATSDLSRMRRKA